jgi:hypothetical protein
MILIRLRPRIGSAGRITDAHDGSRGRNAAPPQPDEMLRDVQAVRSWADDNTGAAEKDQLGAPHGPIRRV